MNNGNPNHRAIIDDFYNRGIPLNMGIRFPVQAYGYSEQAIVSQFMHLQAPLFPFQYGVPDKIIISIVSRYPPCHTCKATLRRLLANGVFKNIVVSRSFGAVQARQLRRGAVYPPQINNIGLSIIYTSVNYPVKSEVDIENDNCFIHSRK